MFKKIRKYYKKYPDLKIVHLSFFSLVVIVVGLFLFVVIHMMVYGVPDRGSCLKYTLKGAGPSTYSVCTKWEYPDGRPKKSLKKPMQGKKAK